MSESHESQDLIADSCPSYETLGALETFGTLERLREEDASGKVPDELQEALR